MDERLVSTYKLAFKTGGKYNFKSEIYEDVSPSVEMHRCITLENLYTTGNELDTNISISYKDNQLVRASDIVPKIGDGFSIYTTGYGGFRYGSEYGSSDHESISTSFFEYNPSSTEYDFETNKYYIKGYMSDGFDNDDPDVYKAFFNSAFFNFVSPFRYLISANEGTEDNDFNGKWSICAAVLKVSSTVNTINGSTNLSNFPVNVICRKIKNNSGGPNIRNSIELALTQTYSISSNLSNPAYKFTLSDSENLNTNEYGYGVSIEIGNLNVNPRNNLGLKLNNGEYVKQLEINLTLSIQVLYDVSTTNDYNYNITLRIDF